MLQVWVWPTTHWRIHLIKGVSKQHRPWSDRCLALFCGHASLNGAGLVSVSQRVTESSQDQCSESINRCSEVVWFWKRCTRSKTIHWQKRKWNLKEQRAPHQVRGRPAQSSSCWSFDDHWWCRWLDPQFSELILFKES